jgi:hypothetical protein
VRKNGWQNPTDVCGQNQNHPGSGSFEESKGNVVRSVEKFLREFKIKYV